MPRHSRRLSANLLGAKSPETAPVSAGEGGAWRAGIKADTQNDLKDLKAQLVQEILSGARAILLDPGQITDKVGSDRRPDWQEQPDYIDLRDSIERYGQDTPIEVWPSDRDWRPSIADPTSVEGVQFEIVTGRRRRAVAEELGIQVRAIIPPLDHAPDTHHWQILLRRYRENNHRSDLTPFERMTSVGEMYTVWSKARPQPSIRQFAASVGIDPSFVSRSVRLFQHQQGLCAQIADPYCLSYRDLESWIANFSTEPSDPKRTARSPQKPIIVNVAGHSIEWKRAKGRLILTIPDVAEDPDPKRFRDLLEGLVLELTSDASSSKPEEPC